MDLRAKRIILNQRPRLLCSLLNKSLRNQYQKSNSTCTKFYSNRYGPTVSNSGIHQKSLIPTKSKYSSHEPSAPSYVFDHTLHKDAGLYTVNEAARLHYKMFRKRLLHEHPNSLIANPALDDPQLCVKKLCSTCFKLRTELKPG